DIPQLASFLLKKLSDTVEEGAVGISDAALKILCDYPFPGNVRELENILERAVTLCDGDTIQPIDLKLPEIDADELASLDNASMQLDPYLDNIEKDAIQAALEKTRYNKTAAAKLLGISFRQLRYRLKKMEAEQIKDAKEE
ncbi:MAG: sigma-54-dependent Fis family transcriptional regulator, partial [Gammaproteobacteria bacterium]|nr:sigma-54-dependent Fis family transcriptional regulator [Gammaproteobacteria bacterium]